MLTKRDVCGLCSLPPTTLQRWIEAGAVTPAWQGDRGPGNGHGFTVMQAVGIAVAAALRAGPSGTTLDHISRVVGAFGDMSEAALQERFAEGRTHFVTVYRGRPVLQPGAFNWLDVQAIYRSVTGRAIGDRGVSAALPGCAR